MRVELSLDALSPLLELVQAAEHAQTSPRNPEGEVDSAPEVMAFAYLMNGSHPSSHMSEMYQSRTIHRAVLRPCEESEWAHVCKKTAMPFTDVALHRIKSANWASSYPLQSSCVMLSSLMDRNGQHDQQWSELQSTIRQEVVQSLNLPTSPVPSSWHQRVEAANHLTSSLLCGPTLMRCTTICVNNPTSNPTAPAHSSARCEAAISVPFRFQLLPLLSGLWPTSFGPTANTREAFLQLPLFKDCEAGAHESLEAVEGVRSDGCGSTSLKALGVELEALGVLPIDDCHDIVKALVGVHALLRMDPHTASEADRVAEGLLSWEGDSTSLREALCTSTDAIHGEETLLDALRNVVAYLLLSSLFTHLDEVMTAATTDLGHRQSTPSTSHTRVVHMVDLRMPQEASCTDSWGATFQAVHKTFLDAFVEGVKEHLEGEYTAEGIPIATNSGDGAASPTAELNEYLVRLWPMRSQEDRSPLWEAGLQVAARFRNPALCRYPEQERSPTASALLERSLFEVASFASSIAAMLRDVARTDAHVLMHHPTEEEDCAGCTLIPRLHAHPSVHLSYPQMAEWLLPLVESPQSVIDLEMGPWMTHDPHALRETYEEAMRAGRFRLAVEQVMPAIPRELSGECGASEAFLTCAAVQRWLQLRAHVHTTHATLIQRIGRAYMGRRQIISGAHPAALSTIIANGREDETARREMLRQHATTVRDVGRLQLIPHLQSAVPRVQNEWRNNMTLMVGELRSALEDIHTAEAERLRVEQRAEEVASAELRAVRAALSERPSRVPPSMKQPTPRRNHHQTSAASAGRTPRQLFERSPSAAHHTTSGLPSEEERRVRTEAQRIRQAQWAALDARDQQDRALQRQASEASERHRISQHLEHQERTRWPHSHVVATPITRRSPSQQHGEVVPTHTVTRARSLTPLSEEASAAAHHRMTQWTAQRDLVSMWESSVMSTL